MDLGKSFSYVFEDDNWISPILLGGLILLIPIIGQLWLGGYAVECARRELRGSSDLLPGLEDFGQRLGDGFKVFVITFVYALPAIIISVLAGILFLVPASVTSGNGDGGFIGTSLIIFFTVCFIPLIILVGIMLQVLSFGGLAVFVATDKVNEALRFGEVYRRIRAELGPVVMVWLVQILASFIGSLGSIAFGIGALFTTVYSAALFGNYGGQFARKIGLSPSAQIE